STPTTSTRGRPGSSACPNGFGTGATTCRVRPDTRRRSWRGSGTSRRRVDGCGEKTTRAGRDRSAGRPRRGRPDEPPGDVLLVAGAAHRQNRATGEVLQGLAPFEMAVLAAVGAGDPAPLPALPCPGR